MVLHGAALKPSFLWSPASTLGSSSFLRAPISGHLLWGHTCWLDLELGCVTQHSSTFRRKKKTYWEYLQYNVSVKPLL